MVPTISNIAFGNAYSSVQANNINGSVHIGLENTLDRLPRAEEAPFNSYTKQHEPECLSDTRVDLLQEIHSWAEGQDERCIFWLSGLAGTGKSTIARTVARSYCDKQRLAASFFFSRGGGDAGHAGKFVTSLAVQLAHNVPASKQRISDAVAERDDIASQSLRDQWQHLVLRPLSKLRELELEPEREPDTYIVVVDALDECYSDNDVRLIVQLLAKVQSSSTSVRLRVFLTSRPEVPIRHEFGQVVETEHRDVVLHNILPSIVDHDIDTFFKHHFRIIAKECHQAEDWPGVETIRQLVQGACGLFIWAATACRFIQEGGPFAADRLRAVLKGGSSADSSSPNDSSSSEDSGIDERFEILPEQRLDSIYLTVLKNPVRRYRKQERKRWYTLVRETLGAIVLLQSPLSTSSLARLLHVPAEDVHQTLYELHSIIDVPQDPNRPVRLHHPSFRDFLLNRKRCGDDRFWVKESSIHEKLATRCLELMSGPGGLHPNMCGLSGPGVLRSEIDEQAVASSLSPDLQYACRYWVGHLKQSQQHIVDGDRTHLFLQKHFLQWLEAMSLIRESRRCVDLLNSLQAIADIYYSALVFAPERSLIRQTFVDQVPKRVEMLSMNETDWDACRSTLEGHSSGVRAVAFSPDGQLIASASDDETVRLWDVPAGTYRSTLAGHSNTVTAVTFSPDGQLVASASRDKTVRLWEAATGTCRSTLEGHSSFIETVVFSPDGQLVASASHDKTVQLWDVPAGTCRSMLERHSNAVTSVVFSPDGELVASASDDETVRLWESATGICCHTLDGQFEFPVRMNFSPDGQVLHANEKDFFLPQTPVVPSLSRSQQQSLHIAVQDQWILRNRQCFLWLPLEYRSETTAVREDIVCLGLVSGRVVLLKVF